LICVSLVVYIHGTYTYIWLIYIYGTYTYIWLVMTCIHKYQYYTHSCIPITHISNNNVIPR